MSHELCSLILELWNCKPGILSSELQAKHLHPQAMSCESSSLSHKLNTLIPKPQVVHPHDLCILIPEPCTTGEDQQKPKQ